MKKDIYETFAQFSEKEQLEFISTYLICRSNYRCIFQLLDNCSDYAVLSIKNQAQKYLNEKKKLEKQKNERLQKRTDSAQG
jgi:hypothetical protein